MFKYFMRYDDEVYHGWMLEMGPNNLRVDIAYNGTWLWYGLNVKCAMLIPHMKKDNLACTKPMRWD